MKISPRLSLALVQLCFVAALSVCSSARAGSATWNLNPSSGDWNTATNWTPATAPNGLSDTATFGLSNTTAISISANTIVDGITFSAGASSYTITASPGFALALSGTGITNNSGSTQNFVTAVDASNLHGVILFANGATAGSGTFFTNSGGEVTFGSGGGITLFHDSSTAGSATITNNGGMINFQPGGGGTFFSNTSTAADATITNNGGMVNGAFDGGFTRFLGSSTAGNARVTNNAGTVQGAGAASTIFDDSATAGSGTFINNGGTVFGAFDGGSTQFFNTSTAANGTFTNNGGTARDTTGGGTGFFGNSTAGNGTFTNNGGTAFGGADSLQSRGGTGFFENSTASNGTVTNNGGTASGALGGLTAFSDTSTAGNATIINNGATVGGAGGGETIFSGFFGTTTAGNATIISNGATVSGGGGGETIFSGSFGTSTAGNATLIANGGTAGGEGGRILFQDGSRGGASRIELFGNGNLDISTPRVTIGSLEGDGNVFLGSNPLTVGSNNLDTTFSGVIQDGGVNGGAGGSLMKIGSGTLALSGANTYTGQTIIQGGILQVDGSIKTNTFVHQPGTLAGKGTVGIAVSNSGRVSPGDLAPGVLTVNGNYTQASTGRLRIDIVGTNIGLFSFLDVQGDATLDGILHPVILDGFIPMIGDSFTFLNYASRSGTFSEIQGQIFDHQRLQWSVTYQPTFAVLTLENTRSVPDQASTLLLLTLSLLGLVSSWHLLRKHP